MKIDCINGSIIEGRRQTIIYCIELIRPPCYKIVENRIVNQEKTNKPRQKMVASYFEDHGEFIFVFNLETTAFTLLFEKLIGKMSEESLFFFEKEDREFYGANKSKSPRYAEL